MGLFTTSAKVKKYDTLTKGQQGLQNQLIGQLGSAGVNNPAYGQGLQYLMQLLQGGPEAFANFEAPIKRQFEEEIIPGIAERFAGLGAGSQSSSAFQQALGKAGAGLSENLGALRSSLQMQALPQALQYAFQPFQSAAPYAFQSAFNTHVTPAGPSALSQLLGPVLGGFGKAFGGGIGTSLAAKLF